MSKDERRRADRRPVLDTFSFAIVIPKKGIHRIPVLDVSEVGLGFEVDPETDEFAASINKGEDLEIRFYVNQSLYVPLEARIVRIEEKTPRLIGAEVSKQSSGYQAFLSVIQMIDGLKDQAKIDVG